MVSLPRDFKSLVSAYSTTSARPYCRNIVPHESNKINREYKSLILKITKTGLGMGFVIK